MAMVRRMGLFRKTSSLMTFGAIDYRSDKERIAKYAHETQRQARAQTRLMRKQAKYAKQQAEAAARGVPVQPAPPPPGWYPDNADPRFVRWWDGLRWTEHVQQR